MLIILNINFRKVNYNVKKEFLSIDCQESDMYYDGLIRASLNYFSTHGYDRCLLSGDTFDAFKNKYRLYHVLDGDYVLLEPFFNLGCGVK